MKRRPFVHLHVHTQYSLLDGFCRLPELVEAVVRDGMPAVAMTDHGVLYGAVEFTRLADEAGVKPIIGCEVYVAPRSRLERMGRPDEVAGHLVLLAQNEDGYKNLLRLVTAGFLEGFYYKPRIDKELLAEHSRGLIGLTACLAGEIPALLLKGRWDEALQLAGFYREVLGKENFYLELQRNGAPEQEEVNQRLLELARRLDSPLVATNDVHYLRRQDAAAHDCLLCIQTGKSIDDPGRLSFPSDRFYFASSDEMASLFADVPEAYDNALEIAERCSFHLKLGGLQLPAYQVPPGQTPGEYLRHLCEEGLARRYPGGASEEVCRRLEYELEVIEKMGYEGYFLIVADFVRFAKERGIPVGPGRGSAAGSLVSYLLGITEVDPLRYGLLFERFLNPERVTMPDVDIDFCYERRGEVIDYVTRTYGEDRVAQIVTFGTLQARAAIRDVGRVLRRPLAEVDRLAKMVPPDPGMTIDRALVQNPELKKLYDADPSVRQLMDLARSIEGMPRHASTHAAGVVIGATPLVETVPLQRLGDSGITTQFDMDSLTEVGVLKMDFLGLRTLTVLERACAAIGQKLGRRPNPADLPLDDPEVYRLLTEGHTVGVFQLESRMFQGILAEVQPSSFEELVAILALGRPGPMALIPEYARRKRGEVPITYLHPVLEPILRETYGIMIYQEQVMQIAQEMAGYTLGQADLLRRAMGKKKPEIMEAEEQSFVQGAVARGISADTARAVFRQMAEFANYGFNKSHATAYALISYQTAYLKCHYPQEFMAALLSSVAGDADKTAQYVAEARRLGVPVLPPHVNYSQVDFAPEGNGIRFGLVAVRNVGVGAAQAIVEERRLRGPFTSPVDFCARLGGREINRKVVESLIKAGALDDLGYTREELLEGYEGWLAAAARQQAQNVRGQGNLFTDLAEAVPSGRGGGRRVEEAKPRGVTPEVLTMEREALGFYLTGHPLDGRPHLSRLGALEIAALEGLPDQERVVLVGLIGQIRRLTTKQQKTMAVLHLEDQTGRCEVVLFPRVYEAAGDWLAKEEIVLVVGRADQREEGTQVLAEEIYPLPEGALLIELSHPLRLEALERLKACLKNHAGSLPVYLRLPANGGSVLCLADPSLWVGGEKELRSELGEQEGQKVVVL